MLYVRQNSHNRIKRKWWKNIYADRNVSASRNDRNNQIPSPKPNVEIKFGSPTKKLLVCLLPGSKTICQQTLKKIGSSDGTGLTDQRQFGNRE